MGKGGVRGLDGKRRRRRADGEGGRLEKEGERGESVLYRHNTASMGLL